MESRLLKDSTSRIFLTEAQLAVQIPVSFTQQSLDDNPAYIDFLKRQNKAAAAIQHTGMTKSPERLHTQRSITRENTHYELDFFRQQKEEQKQDFARRREEWKAAKETEKEELKAQQIRRWTKMKAKITFPEPEEDYYDQTPLKPGVWFWKYLLTCKTFPPSRLQIAIPNMLMIFDELHWAYTDPDSGLLQVTNEFHIGSFYKSFEPFKDGLNPCAVLRIPGEKITEMKALMLNWFEFGEKVIKNQLPGTGLVQRLVKCHGARPTIIRLFYLAQTRLNKASFAYSISNTDAAMKNYFNGRFLVCAEYYDGIEITPQYGQALKGVEEVGAKVVEYLQLAYYIRIDEIVLDFVKDEKNVIWLVSCKGFKLDMAVQRNRELRLAEELGKTPEKVREARLEKFDEQLSAIHCKLCLLPYKSFEMQHVLPFKVLLIYKQHTYRSDRRLLDLSHLRVNSPDFLSHWVSVCKICYMLVVHEYELLETEMKLAALLNVPVKSPQVLGSFQYDHPNFMPALMHQWRLLFYFKTIECGEEALFHNGKLHMQYSFLGSFYEYKLTPTWVSRTEAMLNVSRLYYFFAVRDPGVLHFCNSTSVHFRLTKSKRWDDILATGECRPLSLFTSILPVNSAVVQAFDLLMFKEDRMVATVKLQVGFACDKQTKVKELPVTITRFSNLYVPEPSFITSDSLPDAWMEAFEAEYQGYNESKLIDSSQELDEMYTPVLRKQAILAKQASPKKGKSLLIRTSSAKAFQSQKMKPIIPLLASLEHVRSFQKSTEPSTKRKFCTSASTSVSSKVIYHTDSLSKLKSPTFVSTRVSAPQSYRSTNPESIPLREESIPPSSLLDLQDLISDVQEMEDNSSIHSPMATKEDVVNKVGKYIMKRVKKMRRAKSVPRKLNRKRSVSPRAEDPETARKTLLRVKKKQAIAARTQMKWNLSALAPYLSVISTPGLKMNTARL